MIRIILMNLVFAALYLWGVEYNRYICGALWLIAPMANILLWGIVEKQNERKMDY